MYLAAPSTGGAVFGAVGAGGISLVLAVVLLFGVKGKGKLKLKENPATVFAFLAGTAFHAAGEIWLHPERLVTQGLTGVGVGTGGGPFGDVGIGAVCLLLVAILLFAPLSPGMSAGLGLAAAVVFPAAGQGSIWRAPVELAMAVLAMVAA